MNMHFYEDIQSVLDALLNGEGLQAISDAAAKVLGNPFWIVDMNSKFLTRLSGDTENPVLLTEMATGYVTRRTIEYTEGLQVRHNASTLNGAYLFQTFDKQYEIITCPVKVCDTIVAYVSVINECQPFKDEDYTYMELISKIFGTELEKNDIYRDNKEMMFSCFLTDLLDNRLSFEDISLRLDIIGYKQQKYGYLLNVDLSAIENRRIHLNSISSQISIICKNSIGCFYNKHYVYYFSSDDPITQDDYMIVQLKKFLRDSRLKAAISTPLHSINLASRNYQKTLDAIRLGRQIRPDEVLYTYSTLVVEHAVTILKMSMNYSDFANDAVNKLLAYDTTHNNDLLSTFEAYLFNLCNINKTADYLNIHSNTMRQRLRKIEDITDLTFNNGHQFLEALLAVYLHADKLPDITDNGPAN